MGIFGRRTARERLRRATQQSLTVPTFSAPPDCTPWVIGGLWPPELSASDAETATLADYLRADLERIAKSANDDLRAIRRSELAHSARRAAEAQVIGDARAQAVRRVDSTMRQLRHLRQPPTAPPQLGNGGGRVDMDKTQVLPAIRDVAPPVDDVPAPIDLHKTQVIPAIRDEIAPPSVPDGADEAADGDRRLDRLLAFAARQEPRVNWAIGERLDGTTLLVTDLAHGWIPPGIAIPAGLRLPEPQRRSGRAAELLGATTRAATYAPGESANWPSESDDIEASVEPFELPVVDDLDWELGAATHWREGLPRLAHTLAKAAAGGGEIVEQEADLLRVHLDTLRYQVLAQYPDVELAQLLNCMLLAATEARVAGDAISANYHFAWFKKLSATAVAEPPAPPPESGPRV
ncbi:DUF5631 domain-containing protein [Mycobacterium asiaticum]|uniref:DUF5631 domain-containing protein n=1 Tax=Mycobacterium asiaticum TaxID=1790 RepID=UPI00068587BD|nr:DUF5631 domain-containing protein [Mycobacterium asiaticum]ORA12393.1 hypothetical protein BST16_17190 [Mycobacterium asiaticum DSM 44297]